VNINAFGVYSGGPYSADMVFKTSIATALSEKMRITSDGNVGIGSTNPTSKLYIEGGSANWNETTPGTAVGTIHLDPGVSTDNFGNAITFGASDTSNGENAQAGIYVRSDGGYGTKMYFATTDAYVSGSKTRMFIGNDGNVGIGTTSPNEKLHVFGSIEVSGFQSIGNGPLTMLKSSYNGGANCQVKFLSYNPNNASDSDLGIQVMNGSATLVEAIRVVGVTGNVGIGTTTPLRKLVVTTANNTNSGVKSGALAFFGGGNDNPNDQNISFPNPSVTDGSISGMHWWSADVMFGRYKSEAFWSIKETHGGSLGNLQRDIIRGYFYDSGGYSYIDKVVFPNGNVGIGTTSPGAILDVKASASSFNNKIATFQDAYTGSALDIKSQYSVGSFAHMGIQAYFPGSSPMVYNNIVINGLGGNVGIGVLTPDKILHVSGPIQIDDAFGSDPSTTAGNPRLGIGDVEGEIYLADPAVWLSIYLNGTEYVIPAYDPY
jgi:hypothetical protein